MNIKDLLIIVVAIVIVLILAVFVRPIITGEPATFLPNGDSNRIPNTATPVPTAYTPVPTPATPPGRLVEYTSIIPQTPRPTPTPQMNVPTPSITLLPDSPPTPRPVRPSTIDQETVPREIRRFLVDGEGIRVVPRIFPSSDNVRYSFTQTPDTQLLKSYTGRFSTITDPLQIDSKFFTISYTVDLPEFLQSATPSEDTWAFDRMYSPRDRGESKDDVRYESFSVTNPHFAITVIDAETGEIVRVITQTNLDPRAWSGLFGREENKNDDTRFENISWDPRPWTENIFAGEGEFIFEINANALTSFRVDILTPTIQPVQRDTERLLVALFVQRDLRNLISLFQRDDKGPAYNYLTQIATNSIADDGMKAVVTQQINNMRAYGNIVSGFIMTDTLMYGAAPTLTGTLTIYNAASGVNTIVPWEIAIDSIPPSMYSTWYQGTLHWDGESYKAAWRYPTKLIHIILLLETEFKNRYANEAAFYHEPTLLETYSSDLMLLSAARYQGIDISSGVVPVLPEPYLIPLDMHKFIKVFNADNYRTLAYGESIADTLSQRINESYTLDEIYNFFLEMRYAGIVIQDFLIYNVDIRGNYASLRGEFIWERNGAERRTPCEIIVAFEWTEANQFTMWKLDTLPPLRW